MEADLTPDQLAFIRQAAARYRLDEAGPLMLEALKQAEFALKYDCRPICVKALESVRAAIAAAE